jgi:hypothetical protein
VIRITSCESSTEMDVIFALPTREVAGETVAVVGDFNDWDPGANLLAISVDESEMAARVRLRVGRRYAFRYLTASGYWLDDDTAHRYEPNGMGGHNCILDLPAPSPATPEESPECGSRHSFREPAAEVSATDNGGRAAPRPRRKAAAATGSGKEGQPLSRPAVASD